MKAYKAYRVVCFSLYNEDDDYLDATVEQLRAQGVPNATRSSTVRAALRVVNFATLTAAMKKKRY